MPTIGVVLFTLLSAQLIYFFYILTQESELKKADVIIVFAGSPERIRAGFMLAQKRYAPYIVVSPATERLMRAYKRRYANAAEISWIIERKATSTTENAIRAKRIIRKHNFKSVILVTSYSHLPRSYFLLKAVLIGENISVQSYGKSPRSKNGASRTILTAIDDFSFKEFVEFWGSFLQLLKYGMKQIITARIA